MDRLTTDERNSVSASLFRLHRFTLPSGLRTLVVPMEGTGTVTFFLVVGTGSRHETPKRAGISHFLEHLVFKGSRKRPTTRAISEAIDRVGGEMNACTAKEWTGFYAKAARAHAPLLVDVISDLVLRPLIPPAEIERERGVVIEEINMYEDTPLKSVGELFEASLFAAHPLAHEIIGTKETVTRFGRADILRYWKRQYRAGRAVACLAGDMDPGDGAALLRRALGRFPRGSGSSPAIFRGRYGTRRVRTKTKRTDQTHLVVGAPAVPLLHPDRPAVDLLAALLGGSMSSRLFLEVRERRGLAYAIRTAPEHFVDAGYVATQAGVETRKAAAAVSVIAREHARIGARRVGTSELHKAREWLKGRLLLDLEASEEVAQFVALQEVLTRRILTPDDIFRRLDAVTRGDIQRVARRTLHPRHLRLAVIGPEPRADALARALGEGS